MEPNWRTSSYTGPNGGNCVEVAGTGDVVLVRDTKNRALGHLSFVAGEWSAFVAGLRASVSRREDGHQGVLRRASPSPGRR
ncbi:DUF397 domain-containing protein [Actinorugispora endophytica]|uniref:Uncharacterized protein DUF397 n=1 Tax=Actinorugispora endophytica TaxID=1605990 RepID=A0A4R6UG02_9ACTN|nr:uncharacterized protein DUF397 [Actinorugispora endophytica]